MINIVIGEPLVAEQDLGITEDETTIHFSFDEVKNDNGDLFLPIVLKRAGLFKSTSEVKQVNEQRAKSTKITDPLEKNLWRNLEQPEFTHFKVGKKVFWLVVGQ